jgi:hypothetical protein
MLVGAPRAQSGQPQTNHSGVVFKCSLTTFKKDCVQLKIDQDNKRKIFLMPLLFFSFHF